MAALFSAPDHDLGLGILVFLVLVAVAAPLIAPFDPNKQLDIVHLKNHSPSWTFLLGTDVLSRDVWSRTVYGARVSLGIGALGALVAVALGTFVGAVAGYYQRWIDAVLMRGVDVGLALPRIFILLMAVALWDGLPFAALIIVIGLTSWFGTSRLVRAEVLSLRQRDFVVAARALGAGSGRVIFRHVLRTPPRRSSSPPRWASGTCSCSKRPCPSSDRRQAAGPDLGQHDCR